MKTKLFFTVVVLSLMLISFLFGVRYDRSISDPVIDSLKEVSTRAKYERMKAQHRADSLEQISEQLQILYHAQKSETDAAISSAKEAEAKYNRIKFRNFSNTEIDSTLKALYPKYYEQN